jgi:outer membrane protein W
MKKSLVLLLVSFIITMAGSVYSQPKFTISLTGGYGLPMPQLRGDVPDSVDRAETYLMKTGFNLGLTGKYAVDKKQNVRITLGGSYNKFSVNDNYTHTNDINIHSNIGIISANIGAEYSFTPKDKTRPFVGIDITGNFFSGETTETVTAPDTTQSDHSDLGTTTTKLTSARRFGIALGGGVDVSFNETVGAVFGIKYNFANLIGKEYIQSSAVGEYNLNDKENGTLKSKNIMYLKVYLGVSLFLGETKKSGKK